MDQKSLFFICPRVSARFLHCFCTVSRDARGTLTCKIRQRVQKLLGRKSRCSAQKRRKLETSKIRVFCPVGSFNQRARDSSSLERTKIPRGIVRFLVGFSFFWGSAHFCTLFAHRRESRVFPCIVCILCTVSVFSYPRDTPFKKGRRTKHCAAALKVEIVLLEKALTCPASRGQSCRWWQRPDRTSSADPMQGRSSRTRPARLRGAQGWAASRSERRRRLRPDRR